MRTTTRLARALQLVATILIVLTAMLYIAGILYGAGFAVVQGRSMEPILHSGDLVVIVGEDGYSVGDIVVYRKGDRLIIHRVVAVYQGDSGLECYVVKGDNNPITDMGDPVRCGPASIEGVGYAVGVPGDAIVGKVLEVSGVPIKIPYIGIIKILLENLYS
ncbi:signal peptidase I [Aeropyrum camini]|uniref:Signal peptidase n=1 Tax=Aeropyrum camini SY1 = JCM 12091 TaxID=1198449 RepID=U3TGY2_9CREN|nr:signal peptidase I [Aeropyrum camini]BAN90594.1 signal peptidase [Aeropyrum camini SY1 = JCM 12091]